MNRLRTSALVLIMSGGMALSGGVIADPPEGGNASCFGYEATHVSPPGSESGPFSQFGMPGILAFIDIAVASPDVRNRGEVISAFAQLHEGSHEACDAAAGIPPEAE